MKLQKLTESIQVCDDCEEACIGHNCEEDNKDALNEGRLGELVFGNSLALELYGEFYKDLEAAIKSGDKKSALEMIDGLRKDLDTLRSENKRWHKTFIEIQDKLLDDYQKRIDALEEAFDVSDDEEVDPIPEDEEDIFDIPDIDKEFMLNYKDAGWDEYDDDYYDLDEVELDRQHAALYGGERMYCDCGRRRVADSDGYFYCPTCDRYE